MFMLNEKENFGAEERTPKGDDQKLAGNYSDLKDPLPQVLVDKELFHESLATFVTAPTLCLGSICDAVDSFPTIDDKPVESPQQDDLNFRYLLHDELENDNSNAKPHKKELYERIISLLSITDTVNLPKSSYPHHPPVKIENSTSLFSAIFNYCTDAIDSSSASNLQEWSNDEVVIPLLPSILGDTGNPNVASDPRYGPPRNPIKKFRPMSKDNSDDLASIGNNDLPSTKHMHVEIVDTGAAAAIEKVTSLTTAVPLSQMRFEELERHTNSADDDIKCESRDLSERPNADSASLSQGDEVTYNMSKIVTSVINSYKKEVVEPCPLPGTPKLVSLHVAMNLFKVVYNSTKFVHACDSPCDKAPKAKVHTEIPINSETKELVNILSETIKYVRCDPIENDLDPRTNAPNINNHLNKAASGLYCGATRLIIYAISSKLGNDVLEYTKKLESIFSGDVLSTCIDVTNYGLTYITGGISNWSYPEFQHGDTELHAEGASDITEIKTNISNFFESLLNVLRVVKSLIEDDLLDETKCGTLAFSCIFILTNAIPEALDNSAIQTCQYQSLEVCKTVFALKPGLRRSIIEEFSLNIVKIYTSTKSVNMITLSGGVKLDMPTYFLLSLAQLHSLPSKKMLEVVTRISAQVNDGEEDIIDTVDLEVIVSECKARIDEVFQCINIPLNYLVSNLVKTTQDAEVNVPDRKKGGAKRLVKMEILEEEYKEVLVKIIDTVLNLFNCVEWPVVDMFAVSACKILCPEFEYESKSKNSSFKLTAFQWFGEIAKKVLSRYSGEGYFGDYNKSDQEKYIVDNIMNTADIKQDTPDDKINLLWILQEEALSEVQTEKTPQKLMATSWISISGQVLLSSSVKHPSLVKAIRNLCTVLNDTWTYNNRSAPPNTSVIPNRSLGVLYFLDPHSKRRFIRENSTFYSTSMNFAKDFVLQKIISALDSEVAAIRSRALKILQDIYTSSGNLLNIETYETHIEARVLDRNISVREAAVDFLGKIIVYKKSNNSEKAYFFLSKRVLDIGLSVRKKVLKILKDVYIFEYKNIDLKSELLDSLGENVILIDSARKILSRIRDSEDVIKRLAIKFLGDMWFTIPKDPSCSSIKECYSNATGSELLTPKQQFILSVYTEIILRVTSGDIQSTENFGLLIESINKTLYLKDSDVIMASMIDRIIERIVKFNDVHKNKYNYYDILKLLHIFSENVPKLLIPKLDIIYTSISDKILPDPKATTNLNLTFPVEILKNTLLNIVHSEVNVELMCQIEKDMIVIINKAPHSMLSSAIACLSKVVSDCTKSYEKLMKILRTCLEYVDKVTLMVEKTGSNSIPDSGWRTALRCLLIISLLALHFDYNKYLPEFNDNRHDGSVTAVALVATGYVFSAYPELSTLPETKVTLENVLKRAEQENSQKIKVAFMKLMLFFLRSLKPEDQQTNGLTQANKRRRNDTRVEISSEEHEGDNDLHTCIIFVQNMHKYLLKYMLYDVKPLSEICFNVVEIIILHELMHPSIFISHVIAIQASPCYNIRIRASKLSKFVYSRHGKFMHSQDVGSVFLMYKYLKTLSEHGAIKENVFIKGYHLDDTSGIGDAMKYVPVISSLYKLLQKVREVRNDFICGLVNYLRLNYSSGTSEKRLDTCDGIGVSMFVAGNLALLNYKTKEEVVYLLHTIHMALFEDLSSVEAQVRTAFNDNVFKAYSTRSTRRNLTDDCDISSQSEQHHVITVVCLSINASILILLKTYLQDCYNISSRYLDLTALEARKYRDMSLVQLKYQNFTAAYWEKKLEDEGFTEDQVLLVSNLSNENLRLNSETVCGILTRFTKLCEKYHSSLSK